MKTILKAISVKEKLSTSSYRYTFYKAWNKAWFFLRFQISNPNKYTSFQFHLDGYSHLLFEETEIKTGHANKKVKTAERFKEYYV